MKINNNRKKIKQLFHWYPDSQKREQMIMADGENKLGPTA